MTHSRLRESGFDIALNILRRRKWVGIVAFVATLSLATPFAFVLPDVYRGVTTVIVENQDPDSAFVRGSMPELETRLVTIQQDLLSRARLSELIARLDLYPAWRKQASMESIVQRMRRDIRIEPSRTDRGRPTTIGLKISYIGLDAKSAALVPNTLAALYVEENAKIRGRQTGQMALFLKRQVDAARQVVDLQQARVNRFKEERAGQLPEQVSLNLVTLDRLNTRLRLNIDDQLKLRERQDRLAGVVMADAADPLQSLRERLADLQSRFTDRHPDVIRVRSQIADLEREMTTGPKKSAPRRTSEPSGELASLEREERTLRSEIAAYEHRIRSAPAIQQELEALERDYGAAKESYASIFKRYEEAQLVDSLEDTKTGESVRILDAAVVPTFPAAPNRMRLLIMAVFFAFAAGIGMMLVTEHLDTSFHSVGELRQFTTLPVLATIPFVPSRTTVAGVLRTALTAAAVIGLCVLLAGFAYRTARENTQLVWMLSAPQL